jgi:hypothetical protein
MQHDDYTPPTYDDDIQGRIARIEVTRIDIAPESYETERVHLRDLNRPAKLDIVSGTNYTFELAVGDQLLRLEYKPPKLPRRNAPEEMKPAYVIKTWAGG